MKIAKTVITMLRKIIEARMERILQSFGVIGKDTILA